MRGGGGWGNIYIYIYIYLLVISSKDVWEVDDSFTNEREKMSNEGEGLWVANKKEEIESRWRKGGGNDRCAQETGKKKG
jgi:hypothetical protein